MQMIKEEKMDEKLVVVGGVIPARDVSRLQELGVDGVFPGGTCFDEIVRFIKERAAA
jgi:methylmalonyl-CoA mutase, C-terminal domain